MTGNIIKNFETETVQLLAQYINQKEGAINFHVKRDLELKITSINELIYRMGLNENTMMLKAYDYLKENK